MSYHTPAVLTILVFFLAASALAVPLGRPTPPDGGNIHVFFGVDLVDFDFDPRGDNDFVAAGLDPGHVLPQAMIGIGWMFARPLRLDLVAGGSEVDIDADDVTCTLGRFDAELHLTLFESRFTGLEASTSLGAVVLTYEGLPRKETITGVEVGIGATARFSLLDPFGLTVTYRYLSDRFERAGFELPGGKTIRMHPTGSAHSVRVLVHWDL